MRITKYKKSVCKCYLQYCYNYDNLKKAKTMRIVKRSLFARDCGGKRIDSQGGEDFLQQWNYPVSYCSYTVLYLCHYTFVIYREFRKKVVITLYARQQKRHRCIEQSFGLWERDDMGEWHWNIYNIICETDRRSRFDAWDRVLRAGTLGWPWGMGWGGRWEEGSGWGTHVHPWWIHVNVWQNHYNILK